MILCPVCSHTNDEFAIRCSKCGSFIQDRVPNLDFFSTVWMIIETPRKAFRKIILSEQKNYVLTMALFFGLNVSFVLMWLTHCGNLVDNLLYILLIGLGSGLISGIPIFVVVSYSTYLLLKIFGGKGSGKNTYAVLGWSLVPMMLSVALVLPIELAALGMLLFSTNPTAYQVKPVVVTALFGLDAFLVLWSIVLGSLGLNIAHRLHFSITAVVVLIVIGGLMYALYYNLSQFIVH